MKFTLSILFLILIVTMTHAQTPTIEYRLGMPQPWTHLFEIEVAYRNLPPTPALDFLLPVWRTGRYVIFDFPGSVQEFSATGAGGKTLPWSKTDKKTWRVETKGATAVTVKYKVYANEAGQRTKWLNDEGAFLDGASAFMYIQELSNLPLKVTVIPYKDWHVTTGLDGVEGARNAFSAPNYLHLADCPLFVGNQKDFEFMAEGKKHVLSILGDGDYDSKQMLEDLAKFVKANKEFWGSLPYERYVFMLQLSAQGGGGTEHVNSTIMGARPFGFGNANSYNGFLGLVSHEYFHTWNVKQIRPKGVSPYDWTKENYTKELWIAEGTTSYYSPLMMIRAGFTKGDRYIEQLANQIQGDRQRPGNTFQSASESGFDAWVKYWKGNQQAYNAESDYYDRGADLSLFLDLEIRNRSANKHSLDDVLRAMYKRFPWNGTGYTVDDFQKVCEEFAGGSLQKFFTDCVDGTKPLEWEQCLLSAGLEAKIKEEGKPWLGIQTRDQGDRTTIVRVVAGTPGYDAGLDLNDEIIALNGYRVRTQDIQQRTGSMKAGDKVKLTVMRNERLREFEVALRANPVPSYSVTKVKNPTSLQKAIFESWLKTEWEEK